MRLVITSQRLASFWSSYKTFRGLMVKRVWLRRLVTASDNSRRNWPNCFRSWKRAVILLLPSKRVQHQHQNQWRFAVELSLLYIAQWNAHLNATYGPWWSGLISRLGWEPFLSQWKYMKCTCRYRPSEFVWVVGVRTIGPVRFNEFVHILPTELASECKAPTHQMKHMFHNYICQHIYTQSISILFIPFQTLTHSSMTSTAVHLFCLCECEELITCWIKIEI